MRGMDLRSFYTGIIIIRMNEGTGTVFQKENVFEGAMRINFAKRFIE